MCTDESDLRPHAYKNDHRHPKDDNVNIEPSLPTRQLLPEGHRCNATNSDNGIVEKASDNVDDAASNNDGSSDWDESDDHSSNNIDERTATEIDNTSLSATTDSGNRHTNMRQA